MARYGVLLSARQEGAIGINSETFFCSVHAVNANEAIGLAIDEMYKHGGLDNALVLSTAILPDDTESEGE